MVGGTIGAAVGAATGMGVAAYEYYQETQPKGTVTVGPISAFAVGKSGNGYTDGTNYHWYFSSFKRSLGVVCNFLNFNFMNTPKQPFFRPEVSVARQTSCSNKRPSET